MDDYFIDSPIGFWSATWGRIEEFENRSMMGQCLKLRPGECVTPYYQPRARFGRDRFGLGPSWLWLPTHLDTTRYVEPVGTEKLQFFRCEFGGLFVATTHGYLQFGGGILVGAGDFTVKGVINKVNCCQKRRPLSQFVSNAAINSVPLGAIELKSTATDLTFDEAPPITVPMASTDYPIAVPTGCTSFVSSRDAYITWWCEF